MGCFDGLFANSNSNSQKRKSRTYQKRVRARERELRRQQNGEEDAEKKWFWKPNGAVPGLIMVGAV